MKCYKCKGQRRVQQGFYMIECMRCDGTGELTIDHMWAARKDWEPIHNEQRLWLWRSNMINHNQQTQT